MERTGHGTILTTMSSLTLNFIQGEKLQATSFMRFLKEKMYILNL